MRRIAVGGVLVQALIELDPQYPSLTEDDRKAIQDARATLVAQAPPGAADDPFVAAHAGD